MQADAEELCSILGGNLQPALQLCAVALTASARPALVRAALQALRRLVPCASPAAITGSSLRVVLILRTSELQQQARPPADQHPACSAESLCAASVAPWSTLLKLIERM
jgi:hypothetical protein